MPRHRSTATGGSTPATSAISTPTGYLYVTGRLKNVIICGGFNVIPEEIEARLVEDPAVTAAAVVALPDDRLGEIPVAVVESAGR